MAPVARSSSVKAPKPGPTSRIFSSFCGAVFLTIHSKRFRSRRKFCPKPLPGRIPQRSSCFISSCLFIVCKTHQCLCPQQPVQPQPPAAAAPGHMACAGQVLELEERPTLIRFGAEISSLLPQSGHSASSERFFSKVSKSLPHFSHLKLKIGINFFILC